MEIVKNSVARGVGRPKSSKNKIIIETREWIKEFLTEDRDAAISDFKELTPKERWNVRTDLLSYVCAKPQSVAIENATTVLSPILSKLDELDTDARGIG